MRPAGIRRAGPRALLLDCGSLEAVLAVHAQLQRHPLHGQVDVLAAARTVLAVFDSAAATRAAHGAIAGLDAAPPQDAAAAGPPIRIEVVYDGEDLAEVGRLTGLDPDGVVSAHTGQLWTAAFGGFAPGFAYLVGENEVLSVPRRDTPRTAVPAGAVGLAGPFSAVYPRRSPGGWQLIGRTAAALWDLERAEPALLRPGAVVQYVAVREAVTVQHRAERHRTELHRTGGGTPTTGSDPSGDTDCSLTVVTPGPQSLLQDLGRPGLADLGVPTAGAADTAGARQANRLVGNGPDDAVIETVLGGLAVTAGGELTVALAGAVAPAEITRAGAEPRPAPMYSPFALHDGETLRLDPPEAGLRTYLAVRGGIDVPPVLGSRSTDVLSGLGPPPLISGTVLRVGTVGHGRTVGAPESSTLPAALRHGSAGSRRPEPVELRITDGPRQDWFTDASRQRLTDQTWTVTAESNRIGVRLALGDTAGRTRERRDTPLERSTTDELPSEGVVAGSLQVPPSGLPVVFLADHPVTGGYPVIGVVVPEDLPVAAQLPPGTPVRFRAVDPDTLLPLGRPPTTRTL